MLKNHGGISCILLNKRNHTSKAIYFKILFICKFGIGTLKEHGTDLCLLGVSGGVSGYVLRSSLVFSKSDGFVIYKEFGGRLGKCICFYL